MSFKKFEDDCPGCRPALMDAMTGEVIPESDPKMKAVLGVWAETTRREREAFHNVTCNNSRNVRDLALVNPLVQRMQQAMLSVAG